MATTSVAATTSTKQNMFSLIDEVEALIKYYFSAHDFFSSFSLDASIRQGTDYANGQLEQDQNLDGHFQPTRRHNPTEY
jgi:hypothetical protein